MWLLFVMQLLVSPPPPMSAGDPTDIEIRFWQGLTQWGGSTPAPNPRTLVADLMIPLSKFTCGVPLPKYEALPFTGSTQQVAYKNTPTTACVATVSVPVPTLGGEVEARFWSGQIAGGFGATMPIRTKP